MHRKRSLVRRALVGSDNESDNWQYSWNVDRWNTGTGTLISRQDDIAGIVDRILLNLRTHARVCSCMASDVLLYWYKW